MTATIEVPVHLTQQEFLDSTALFRGFAGGRGSGKTFAGALDLLLRSMSGSPNRLYAVYAPTYPMLRDSSWRTLLDVGEKLRCLRDVNRSDNRLVLGNGSEIVCRSVDDPERARGPNLSGAWLDEASLMKKSVYHIAIASLREAGEQGWLSATFTPKGRAHWTYDVFGRGGVDIGLFHARSSDNPFLPSGFVEAVRSQYPTYFAQQELEGLFIDPPGAVFKREWFWVSPYTPEGLQWYRYWDLAASMRSSADYTASVAVAMGPDGTIYLRDMIRGRWEWPDQEKIIVQTILAEPSVQHGIEKALHGIAAVQSLLRRPELAGTVIKGITVEGDKLSRSLALAARAEQGKVALVEGPWIPSFIDELAAFTGVEDVHDDQVDTASGGLRMMMQSLEVRSTVSRVAVEGLYPSRTREHDGDRRSVVKGPRW